MSLNTEDHFVQRTFLLLTLILLFVSTANGFISFTQKSDVDHSYGSLNTVNNAADKDAAEGEGSQPRIFFGGKGVLLGARRRLQFALLPIMYKLGVISTMLVGLTVMVLKGLTIGVILLFFALGNALAKYKFHHPAPTPVHFHLHPGDHHSKGPLYHPYEPSGPWDKTAEDSDSTYENYYPGNHRRVYPYRYSHRDYYGHTG